MSNTTHFSNRLDDIPSRIWTTIAQIEELKGRWSAGTNLSPQFLSRLKRSVLITSTGASTRIEGSNLSDEDVEKLMRGIAIEKFADRDEQEVRGYFELLENVFAAWENLSVSESTILHFHQELLKYVEKDSVHRGKYKSKENQVQMVGAGGKNLGMLFETTRAYLTPKEMSELVNWTHTSLSEKTHHPLLTVGNFIVEFLNIHPFEDGNGRLSRILTNVLLLQEGYGFMPYVSHEKLIEEQKPDYYMALRTSQKTFCTSEQDLVPWLDFFLGIVLEQAQRAVQLTTEENIELLLSPKQLAVWQYLHTVGEATPKEIADHALVARPTVNQVINKLLHMKKVQRIGEGSSIHYVVVK
ncbi:MAG: Fic family protein [Patescibacteria group bacterium]